jgi:uncharacterized protein (DUF1015 family)
MVEITPFRGYRFNPDKVESFAAVIAPPYDVIDAEMQNTLHNRSPYNISKITKGEKHEEDTDTENQYSRAAVILNQWIADGILLQDDKPAIYVLAQEFNIGIGDTKRKLTRAGFIALLKLEEFCSGGSSGPEGTCVGIHQHEETLPKDIEDRLCLCKTTLTNFGQIFAIFPDHQRKTEELLKQVMVSNPVAESIDDEGVNHKLWLMQDEIQVAELTRLLANKSVIIADGHHRYKTALNLQEEHDVPGDTVQETSKYRMMTFVNMMNEGLVILPTHRLIQKIDNFDAEKLLNEIEPNFTIETFPIEDDGDNAAREKMFAGMKSAFEAGKNAFGLYCKTGNYYLIILKDINTMNKVQGKSDAWRKLDVSILHQLILKDYLGIDKAKLASGTITGGAYVEYIKDIGDAVQKAIDKVNTEGYQAVFFMNPTRASEVEAVATNHETMPQKSTFFYPKIYTGYVINKL